MKLTKSKLQKIIKEEIGPLDELFGFGKIKGDDLLSVLEKSGQWDGRQLRLKLNPGNSVAGFLEKLAEKYGAEAVRALVHSELTKTLDSWDDYSDLTSQILQKSKTQ